MLLFSFGTRFYPLPNPQRKLQFKFCKCRPRSMKKIGEKRRFPYCLISFFPCLQVFASVVTGKLQYVKEKKLGNIFGI
jgi:hypothetical protein